MSKITKFQRQLKNTARFIVRFAPEYVDKFHDGLSNSEISALIREVRNKVKNRQIPKHYMGFYKQFSPNMENYAKKIEQRKEPIIKDFMFWLSYAVAEENHRKFKRKKKRLSNLAELVLEHFTYEDSKKMRDALMQIENSKNMDEVRNIILDIWKETAPEVAPTHIIVMGVGEIELGNIPRVSDEDFPLFKKLLIDVMRREIKDKEREEKVYKWADEIVEELEKEYNADIELIELGILFDSQWGIKICVNGRCYLFDFYMKNKDDLRDVIEDVVLDVISR